MHPLLILLVGMATILAGILGLRLNAFLALVAAAIVVSLLAPGEPAVKIARVAEGFGRTAGTIGIVIALAAIAGKAMMDSGAADRIVRAFIALLGEQRSATALCATGYVLSIPVFFDTVFYLLVPLARSGYTRTNRYYLKYLLATAGVHHHLVREGTRTRCGLVVESGDAREVHHVSLLLGYGAGVVNPYLAFETIDDMIRQRQLVGVTHDQAVTNYIHALNKGILKVMSKMGISTLQGYCGAQIFEAVGLNRAF